MGWAAVLGFAMGFLGLAYLFVIEEIPHLIWGDFEEPGFAGGQLWWIPLAVAFGLIVGFLRKSLGDRAQQVNVLDEVKEAHVELRRAPGTVGVSIVSLIGGSSLGPEAGLGTMGGGLGALGREAARAGPGDDAQHDDDRHRGRVRRAVHRAAARRAADPGDRQAASGAGDPDADPDGRGDDAGVRRDGPDHRAHLPGDL